MNLLKCPKCNQELTILQSSGRQVCRICGWLNKLEKDTLVSSSINDIETKIIPVEIEVKDLGGLSISQNIYYNIKFSDGTQKEFKADISKLPVDFIIWSWRINNSKSEKDYITFGMEFSEIQEGIIISEDKIKMFLTLAKTQASGFRETWYTPKLERELTIFLFCEIARYLREQRNNSLIVEPQWNGDLKIISKPKVDQTNKMVLIFSIFLGILYLLSNNVNRVSNVDTPSFKTNSVPEFDPNDPAYIRSVQERTGIGETIDSPTEIFKACIVMNQDLGMTYSQAYERCN